ncbi:MAG: transglycosylase domain-containing protein, partial [Halobacteriovoraceae bacterium]|nr:transglycosylase domain-containing protein [Halobacteriovoraceae bacterium]
VFAAGLFVYTTISEIEIEKITGKTVPQKFEAEKTDQIEAESLVLKSDLKVYWSWLDDPRLLENFLSELKEKGKLEVHKKKLFFKEQISFPKLLENDCQQVYCLQSRLSFPEIPSILWRGLIGIEDYRFLDHPGVDPRSLARALWHDLKVGRLEQGGSTLTQQLAKNLFYTNEKKFSRKFKEMIASAYIELKLSKEEILKAYFNEVMWGSLQGIKIKGVEAAASVYFKKSAENLSPYEASILISMLKGPYYYSPVYKMERLKSRVKVVFEKLKSLQLFPEDAYEWNDNDWKLWNKSLKEEANGITWRSLFLLTKKSPSKRTFSNFIFLRESNGIINKLKEDYPKADLAIKTILLNIGPDKIEEEFRHYSKIERGLDRAFTDERHQIGSTVKPLIYGLLVENGYELDEEIDTTPVTLDLISGKWSPREAHKGIPEKVTLKTALIQSLNRPVVKLVQKFGFEKFENKLKEVIPRLQVPLAQYPAQLLGASELSMQEFSKIYGSFVQKACWKNISSGVLDALSDPTTTTVRYRVGEKMGQMRFFGKTGTTNLGFDTWFVGFNGKELMMVWIGLESGRDKQKELKIYGSNSSFLVYRNYYQFRGRRFDEMACQEP